MTEPESTNFSAANSALGYLYQCRYALLSALTRLKTNEEFLLSIETLDDVVFENTGSALELLQTKHHIDRKASLSDASADIWKTLRVWSEGIQDGTIPDGTVFYLVSTSAVSSGSAASYLRVKDRDVDSALRRLEATARTSASDDNKKAYKAFLTLTATKRIELLSSVTILDSSPVIGDLDSELAKEVFWAVDRSYLDSFLTRLEGWWFRRVVRHLDKTISDPILSEEIESQMRELREQFKSDSLPIDDDLLVIEEVDASGYKDAIFVQQLQLIGIGVRRVLIAIRDYYRAYEQRSRWMREDLLLVGELNRYESRLVEEWQLVFERVRDELGAAASEEAKQKASREVLKWVEESVFPIRQNVKHEWVTRGSFHMLSDRLKVGWHPDFLERLQHLLEREVA